MQLNKFNGEVYAAKHYTNETCLSRTEFMEDLARADLAQKMARKVIRGSSVNIRLLCNHVLCFTNNFEISAAKNMLMFDITNEEREVLKTILNYFGFLRPGELPHIKFHLETAKLLKEMDQ